MPVLERAVRENDIVLFSGGSSVGVRDLGEQAIADLGPPGILVHGVALKPGKPVIIVLLDSWGKLTRIADANRIKRWMETRVVTQTAG